MYQKQFVSYEIISRCDGVSGGFYRPVCGWCRGGSECSDRCWITDSGPVNGGVFFWTDRPWERLHGNDGKCPRTAWKRGSLADCHLFLSLVFLPLFFIPLHQPVCPSCPPLSIFTSASLMFILLYFLFLSFLFLYPLCLIFDLLSHPSIFLSPSSLVCNLFSLFVAPPCLSSSSSLFFLSSSITLLSLSFFGLIFTHFLFCYPVQ